MSLGAGKPMVLTVQLHKRDILAGPLKRPMHALALPDEINVANLRFIFIEMATGH